MFQATIASNQVFHLYDPLRIDQYRGVTAFCTAINDATDIYEIVQMEKMAAKIASSQGGIIKRNNNNATDLANLTNDLDSNNQTIKIESIEPGRITYLEPGEEMQFPDSPNRPGNGFQEFHKILLRNICMGVGIPYSFAVDPSAMSGPTARLEMQQASRTFKRHQKLLEDKVLRPVKNIVIADAVSRGLIKNNLGTKTTKGVFNFGANVSIDLGRESESAIAEFKSGLRTGSDIMAERGQDFESSIILKAQEAKKISDLANQYNIPATSISDITESALFAQAQSRSQLNPDGSPATTEQGAKTDGSPTPTGQEALIDYSLNGAQISSLIQIINAVAAGAITQEGANAIIRGAFPNIPDQVIQSIVGGINVGTLAPTGKVSVAEAAQAPAEQTKPEKLGSNDIPPIGEQDTETGKYESGGDGDIDVGEEREPTEKGSVENLPTGSTKEGKLTPKVPSILEELDCGTGAGGFQPGNTCAGGKGTSETTIGKSLAPQEPKERYRDRIEGTDEEVKNEIRKADRKVKRYKEKILKIQKEVDSHKENMRLLDEKIARTKAIMEKQDEQTKQRVAQSKARYENRLKEIAKESDSKLKAIGDRFVDKIKKLYPDGVPQRVKDKYPKYEFSEIEKNDNLQEKADEIDDLVQEKKQILDELNKLAGIKEEPDNQTKEDFEIKKLANLDDCSMNLLVKGMLNACELGKYSDIDFTPPQGVKEAAKRGLEVRATKPASQRGGTPVGIARARDLSGGKAISPDTARRMKAFFDRHEVDKEGSTWSEKGKGWQAWQLWGGDAGYAWAKKLVKQMNSRDEQLEEPAACSIATQDIKTNLENRQNAVDDANYGPANPNEPNDDYWKAKANEFQGDVATAKKMLCGNCAAFNQTKKLLGCISKGIGEDAGEVEMGGNLGYCEIFDFKCAAKRTCDAWIVGGPITDNKIDKKV
jgi:hypothetical protein